MLSAILCVFGTSAMSDDNAIWMCLFENLPITITERGEDIGNNQIAMVINSHVDFEISAIAIDVSASSQSVGSHIEESVVIPLPALLQPSEARQVIAWLPPSDTLAEILQADDVVVRAAPANVLDKNEQRLVLRENIGPSFRVFWPSQHKSREICE
jgi:hypothetical protein